MYSKWGWFFRKKTSNKLQETSTISETLALVYKPISFGTLFGTIFLFLLLVSDWSPFALLHILSRLAVLFSCWQVCGQEFIAVVYVLNPFSLRSTHNVMMWSVEGLRVKLPCNSNGPYPTVMFWIFHRVFHDGVVNLIVDRAQLSLVPNILVHLQQKRRNAFFQHPVQDASVHLIQCSF